jgi:hypothetical protein
MVRFPGRHWRALPVVFAGFVLLAGAVPALASVTAATAARPSAPSGGSNTSQAWSTPAPLPQGTALGTGAAVTPSALDCPATGDCTAVGSASPASDPGTSSEGFVDSQANGVWQPPQQIPGLQALSKDDGDYAIPVRTVSCSSPGNCAAGGAYTYDGDVSYPASQPFVATETNGKWGPAQLVPGIAALNTAEAAVITSLSCTAPGYCTAAGTYATKGPTPYVTQATAFTTDEVAGKWQPAHPVLGLPGPAGAPNTAGAVVSCVSPGDCTVGAAVTGTSGTAAQVASDTKFKWSAIRTIKGMSQLGAIDCTGLGDCAAVGGNQVAQSSDGSWSSASTLAGTSLGLSSLSCGSTGNCLAGGIESTSAAVVAEKNGIWGTATTLTDVTSLSANDGYANVSTVSCATSGECEAGGGYTGISGDNSVSSGFAVEVDQGKPMTPQKFTAGGVGLISCDTVGSCGGLVAALEGSTGVAAYNDFSQKLLTKTSTALALSSAKTTYGHENAERMSVLVAPESRDPDGKVVIKAGKTTLCTVTLKSAKGSCALTARQLKPGSYALIATYLGAPHFKPSVSPGRTLTVVT